VTDRPALMRQVEWSTAMKSFKVGVKTSGDRDWNCNGLRFATATEAERYAIDLACRWTAVQDWTVLPSDEEPNR
jgi:hypothetical protein